MAAPRKRHARKKTKRRKQSIKRRIAFAAFKLGIFTCLVLACLLGLYTIYVSVQVQERFAGRRWSIPSRVYADSTLLYPGQPADAAFLENKLKRLDYKAVQQRPDSPGEYRLRRGSVLEIALRPLKVPGRQCEGLVVRINLTGGRIKS